MAQIKAEEEGSVFERWTRKPEKGALLRLPMAASKVSTIRLDADHAKRADQVAALFAAAPTDARDAAVADNEKMSDADYSDLVATVRISTERIDSYNSTIAVDGWETSDFRNNPVVLFAHKSSELPVARDMGTFVDKEKRALMGVSRFVSASLGAQEAKVGKWVGAGLLNATSVGFEPIEWEINEDRDDGSSWFYPVDFVRQSLREYSWVPVPANPDCLVDARAIRALGVDPREFRAMLEGALESAEAFYLPRRTLLELHRALPGTAAVVDMGALGTFSVTRGRVTRDDVDETRGDMTCRECGHVGPSSEFQPAEADAEGEPSPAAESKGAAVMDVRSDVGHPARQEERGDAVLAAMASQVVDLVSSGRLP